MTLVPAARLFGEADGGLCPDLPAGLCSQACCPAVAASFRAPALTFSACKAEWFPTELRSAGAAALSLFSPLSCPLPLPDGCSGSQKHWSSFPVPPGQAGGGSAEREGNTPRCIPGADSSPCRGALTRLAELRRRGVPGSRASASPCLSRQQRQPLHQHLLAWQQQTGEGRGCSSPQAGHLATPWSCQLSRDLLGAHG